MFKLLKKLWRDRRGNALVIAGAALPLIIGSAGLASDTIQWALMKRQLQRTADSAALAGVYGKMASQTVNTGTCDTANSQPVFRDVFTQDNANTRLDATVTCSVKVSTDIDNASWTGAGFNAVEVKVQASRPLAFSGLFLSSPPIIQASAIAAVVQSGKYCVISLKNNTGTGLSFSGNPTVNLGCGMKTNAKGASAVDATGNNNISASPVASVGQISGTSQFVAGTTFQPYSAPQTDPFASVTAPTVPNGCNQAALHGNNHTVSASNGTVCYTGLSMNSGDTATFTDETVILNGGNMAINGGTLNCTRCTFVMTSSDGTSAGSITINAGATVNMSPPTTGSFANLVIYKDRRTAYCNNCNSINGNSTSTISGGIYAPTQEVQMNGSGGVSTACVQIVSWTVTFNGNASISNTCPSGGPHAFDGTMVRLVA